MMSNWERMESTSHGDTSDPSAFNAVRVTLRRQAGSNGELPLFFGSITGRQTQSLHTTATAAMFSAIERLLRTFR